MLFLFAIMLEKYFLEVILYKIGDIVKVVHEESERVGDVGTVINTLDYIKNQFVRVSFSSNMFDYIDIGSWKLEKVPCERW